MSRAVIHERTIHVEAPGTGRVDITRHRVGKVWMVEVKDQSGRVRRRSEHMTVTQAVQAMVSAAADWVGEVG